MVCDTACVILLWIWYWLRRLGRDGLCPPPADLRTRHLLQQEPYTDTAADDEAPAESQDGCRAGEQAEAAALGRSPARLLTPARPSTRPPLAGKTLCAKKCVNTKINEEHCGERGRLPGQAARPGAEQGSRDMQSMGKTAWLQAHAYCISAYHLALRPSCCPAALAALCCAGKCDSACKEGEECKDGRCEKVEDAATAAAGKSAKSAKKEEKGDDGEQGPDSQGSDAKAKAARCPSDSERHTPSRLPDGHCVGPPVHHSSTRSLAAYGQARLCRACACASVRSSAVACLAHGLHPSLPALQPPTTAASAATRRGAASTAASEWQGCV